MTLTIKTRPSSNANEALLDGEGLIDGEFRRWSWYCSCGGELKVRLPRSEQAVLGALRVAWAELHDQPGHERIGTAEAVLLDLRRQVSQRNG